MFPSIPHYPPRMTSIKLGTAIALQFLCCRPIFYRLSILRILFPVSKKLCWTCIFLIP